VAKAKAKTLAKAASKCTEIPDFAFTDPNTVNRVAMDKEIDLAHEIFGPDLDAVIRLMEDDAGTARCQADVAKAVEKCQDAKLKMFPKCKKSGLKEVDSVQIVTPRQLATACLMKEGDPTTGQPDPGSKIAKACGTKLTQKINKSCAAADRVAAFPGCSVIDVPALTSCLDRLVECQVCLALNEADNLARDCDFFDDGLENGSCAGLGPACGNSVLEIGEMCDDGNTDSCDGCSAGCRTESGLVCGDGTLNTACGEACDDGDTDSCDGCSELCEIELGLICGDSVLNTACGEECEQDVDCGAGEACSVLCTCEFVGIPVCGDGLLQSGEACDDGNTDDGDCCSSICQIESASTVCRPAVGVCDVPELCTARAAAPAAGTAPRRLAVARSVTTAT
jgi:cysteine-rich repeat protein